MARITRNTVGEHAAKAGLARNEQCNQLDNFACEAAGVALALALMLHVQTLLTSAGFWVNIIKQTRRNL